MWRIALRTTLLLVALIFAYLGAAFIGALVPRQGVAIAPSGGPTVDVGLISGLIHVDFVLPATDATRRTLAFGEAGGVPVFDSRVSHFIVGWGARQFYTTVGQYSDVSVGAIWKAATGDSAVLRIDVVDRLPTEFLVATLKLDPAEYTALLAAIDATKTGQPLVTEGFTQTDGFHEACGRFHVIRTCNTWISKILNAAGLDTGFWTPTTWSVRLAVNRHTNR